MLMFYTQDYIYIKKFNILIPISNLNTCKCENINTIDEFESDIHKYAKIYYNHNNISTKEILNIISLYRHNKLHRVYKDEKSIKSALSCLDIIVYTLFFRLDKEENLNYSTSEYLNYIHMDYSNAYKKSTGSKFIYFYRFHKYIRYDSYGEYEPYISAYDIRVCKSDFLNNNTYRLGCSVKFYNQCCEIHQGIITQVIKNATYKGCRQYEIYDERNNKLYYDNLLIYHDDIINIESEPDITKVKDIINHPEKYHKIPYWDKYVEYINSL